MAEEETDISELTEDQQLALQQYIAVTDQNLAQAVPLLKRCEWNVQIAIARFFDGEPAAIEPEAPPPPQSTRRQETLANGFDDIRRTARPRFEAAPRVVSQPENQISQQPPFILSLLVTPVNLVYALFSRMFGVFSRLFPFLPRMLNSIFARQTRRRTFSDTNRRPLGPQDTTARFLREFEEDYGTTTLPFMETGYARAFDLAKRDLKFLLIIPLSMEHDETDGYIRNVLLSDTVTTFLNNPENNIILWSGTIQDSETFQVASELKISTFPSAVLIAHTPSVSATAMSVVGRITGTTTPEEFTARLQAAMSQHSVALNQARHTRAEQQASRSIRQEQDSAYERSLAQDRERARQRREAEVAAARAEKEAREKIEREEKHARDLTHWRQWRANHVQTEPDKEDKTAVRIQIRLPDGERVIRRFDKDAELEEVYAFVECFEFVKQKEEGEVDAEKTAQEAPEDFVHEYAFQLVSPMPREVYDLISGGKIGARIGRSGNLIVEKLEDEIQDTS